MTESNSPSLPAAVSEATPLGWRLGIAGSAAALAGLALLLDPIIGPRGRAVLGVVCFILITAVFSSNLRAINWRTIVTGILMQVLLVAVILKLGFTRPTTAEMRGEFLTLARLSGLGVAPVTPLASLPFLAAEPPTHYFYRPGYQAVSAIGQGVKRFLEFTEVGSQFVFGILADPAALGQVAPGRGFVFAFSALPTIIFVSSFFTVLYYLGILQAVVRFFARSMMGLMQTSGAETLSAVANVFMGQTEAPLIVKPYVPRMTKSELLAMMVGGMATISGGVMAVYIGMGADPVAILATSVMAAPCSLYLSKILLPETETPQTQGRASTTLDHSHRNIIDAASAGASDGLQLALNIAAMLIAFLALLAMVDFLLKAIHPALGLQNLFGMGFAPLAFLMGVERGDIFLMGDLLGTKLVANEFVAYVRLTTDYRPLLRPRSYVLATFALTGFANFASIGIQLGGIGAMAPGRRADLAHLGWRALLAGFLATLINAAMAGVLLDDAARP